MLSERLVTVRGSTVEPFVTVMTTSYLPPGSGRLAGTADFWTLICGGTSTMVTVALA